MWWNLQKNPADARPADPPHSSVVVVVHNATMPFELPTPAAGFCGGDGGGLLVSIESWLRKNKDPYNDGLWMFML